MGSAELGRELGDAGGPLLVGGIATLTALPFGLGALALLVAAASLPRLPEAHLTSNARSLPAR
ncbi:hypothetical protein AHiyo4_39300 [Arthrobacter sp. Hiyo4]|nr:hypothetical protein AHiyo4_39300 [Arthrobacter sp. Hiyo4]